jgi:hypothetical protein
MGMLMKQARRDLNPQPPDLESGALAVRATGPSHGHALSDSKQHLLFRICSDRDVYSKNYRVSRCTVCFRQKRQYFLRSSRSGVVRLFFMVE